MQNLGSLTSLTSLGTKGLRPNWPEPGVSGSYDFLRDRYYPTKPQINRAGEVLMLGPNGYQAFAAGELARIDGIGAQVAPARVNKCTNYNAAPTDLTGVMKAGDAAATLTVVDDSAELAAAGLADICSSGMVYKLDNSQGVAWSYVQLQGQTGNASTHTGSVMVRGGSGRIRVNSGAAIHGQVFDAQAEYRRVSTTETPETTTRNLWVQADPGSIVYFILNQLEEGTYASPPIITSGAAVSRPGDILRASVPDGGRAFVFEFDLLEPVVRTGTIYRRILEFSNGVSNANSYTVTMHPTTKKFILSARVGGVVAEPQSHTIELNEPGKVILAGVTDRLYRRLSLNGVDTSAITTLAEVSGISRVGIGGNGANTAENTFIHPRLFTERPVTDFATPADAFAWAKSIAQGWA